MTSGSSLSGVSSPGESTTERGPAGRAPGGPAVPRGVEVAAAWSWRLLLVAAAGLVVLWLMAYFALLTVPLAVALLVTALASPLSRLLSRAGLPPAAAAGIVVLVGLGALAVLLTFAGRQVAEGFQDLADQVAEGLGQIRQWLQDGPLNASDTQVEGWIGDAQQSLLASTRDNAALGQVTEVGVALGNVLAGFFIVLFATFFFLADGERIWGWCVRLAPRAARERLDDSGRVAWISLTQFVRATVLVALVDAIGVMIVAAVLGVPLVFAIGVLVFLGAFVPLLGATVAGGVAVLVALVDAGPVTALLMLAGVVLVQQVESHVLQPFLMGRFVSVHPLGVVLALGAGIVTAGIAGALIAVPLVAAGNAVVLHLTGRSPVGAEPAGVVAGDVDVAPDDAGPSGKAEDGERSEEER